jgi:Amt family ammonium transporter
VGLKFKFGLDDSLDVVGVHLVGGVVGTVLIGLFSTTADADAGVAGGAVDGLLYGGGIDSLVDQVLGVLVAIAWSAVATTIIALVIKFTIGWRLTEEDEVEGIDFVAHGESAYDIHTSGGGSSSVLAAKTAPVTEGANA